MPPPRARRPTKVGPPPVGAAAPGRRLRPPRASPGACRSALAGRTGRKSRAAGPGPAGASADGAFELRCVWWARRGCGPESAASSFRSGAVPHRRSSGRRAHVAAVGGTGSVATVVASSSRVAVDDSKTKGDEVGGASRGQQNARWSAGVSGRQGPMRRTAWHLRGRRRSRGRTPCRRCRHANETDDATACWTTTACCRRSWTTNDEPPRSARRPARSPPESAPAPRSRASPTAAAACWSVEARAVASCPANASCSAVCALVPQVLGGRLAPRLRDHGEIAGVGRRDRRPTVRSAGCSPPASRSSQRSPPARRARAVRPTARRCRHRKAHPGGAPA